MQVLGVIPARLGSTRLPQKPLADIGGHMMVEWVYRAVRATRRIHRVIVATDDRTIAAAVRGFGGQASLTSHDHASGTDRMAEVARTRPHYGVLVNVQGDEPLIGPGPLDALVEQFLADGSAPVATLVRRAQSRAEVDSAQTVKVALARDGSALYFSRAPIPHERDGAGAFEHRIHVGVYAYRRDFLLTFAGLERGRLEEAEKLEQLRVLEHGYRILTVETDAASLGVDTPEDLERVRAEVAARRLKPW